VFTPFGRYRQIWINPLLEEHMPGAPPVTTSARNRMFRCREMLAWLRPPVYTISCTGRAAAKKQQGMRNLSE
jgi:hypothetical protein